LAVAHGTLVQRDQMSKLKRLEGVVDRKFPGPVSCRDGELKDAVERPRRHRFWLLEKVDRIGMRRAATTTPPA
jgi:hypothetical protein